METCADAAGRGKSVRGNKPQDRYSRSVLFPGIGEEGQEKIGYDIFCTNHQIGRMPPEMVSRSIELFGKEVIPAFVGARIAAASTS